MRKLRQKHEEYAVESILAELRENLWLKELDEGKREKILKLVERLLTLLFTKENVHRRAFNTLGRKFLLLAVPDTFLTDLYTWLRDLHVVEDTSRLDTAFSEMLKPYVKVLVMDEDLGKTEGIQILSLLAQLKEIHVKHFKDTVLALMEGRVPNVEIKAEPCPFERLLTEKIPSYLLNSDPFRRILLVHRMYHTALERTVSSKLRQPDQLYNSIKEMDNYSKTLLHLIQEEMLAVLSGFVIKDPLTGLYSRQYLEDYLNKEMSRVKRHKLVISLLFIDLDDFKWVNDTYGHMVGDVVLKSFASLLKENLRSGDIPVRYGGDEFVVILPHTSAEGAMVVAERIRRAVENHVFEAHNVSIKLTVSIGVTPLKEEDDVTSFLERADRAMYCAKREGKNRVVLLND
ncbi:diguanylate cyclase [Thermocrinis albus DSM 14484]|uniref:diguanylate cyclase n=1 Tax=Thermocrinis albus (strain DSM 14484 / JCM 11386 / HI 11/12) TaxID=638303 RepID=D3SQ78_THEAH|nr:GGDEF domain-containing protein [Thermocrinis albus]ADC89315.1 diguanylate cyclase [Thermocrinis albus DSM 14484]